MPLTFAPPIGKRSSIYQPAVGANPVAALAPTLAPTPLGLTPIAAIVALDHASAMSAALAAGNVGRDQLVAIERAELAAAAASEAPPITGLQTVLFLPSHRK